MSASQQQRDKKSNKGIQLGLFTTALGEYTKEAVQLCLRFDPPRVRDLSLLDSVCMDLKNHRKDHDDRTSIVESASDIECLNDSMEMIDLLIDNFDEWRIQRRGIQPVTCPLSRTELNSLFEIRYEIRTLIIELYK